MISCPFKTTKPKCSKCSGVTGCHLPLVLMHEITVQERKIVTTTQPPWVKCQPNSLMPKRSQKERGRTNGEQRGKDERGSEERKSSMEMGEEVIWWMGLTKELWCLITKDRRAKRIFQCAFFCCAGAFSTARPIVLSQEPTCSLQCRHCIYAVQQLLSLSPLLSWLTRLLFVTPAVFDLLTSHPSPRYLLSDAQAQPRWQTRILFT